MRRLKGQRSVKALVFKAWVVLEFLQCGLYSGVDRNIGKQLFYVERYHDIVV